MAKRHVVELTDDQRAALERREAGPLTRRQRNRVQILLRADAGDTDEEIADEVGVSIGTVANVRRRFAAGGLDAALNERPRPGAGRCSTARPRRSSSPWPAAPSPRGGPPGPPACWPTAWSSCRSSSRVSEDTDPPGPEKSDLKPWQKQSWCLPEGGRRRVRPPDGGRAGAVRRAVRPGPPGGLLRRGEQGAARRRGRAGAAGARARRRSRTTSTPGTGRPTCS